MSRIHTGKVSFYQTVSALSIDDTYVRWCMSVHTVSCLGCCQLLASVRYTGPVFASTLNDLLDCLKAASMCAACWHDDREMRL